MHSLHERCLSNFHREYRPVRQASWYLVVSTNQQLTASSAGVTASTSLRPSLPYRNIPLKLFQAHLISEEQADVVTVDVAEKVASSQPGHTSIEGKTTFLPLLVCTPEFQMRWRLLRCLLSRIISVNAMLSKGSVMWGPNACPIDCSYT